MTVPQQCAACRTGDTKCGDVNCRTCHAVPGEPCGSVVDGRPIREPHPTRVFDAHAPDHVQERAWARVRERERERERERGS